MRGHGEGNPRDDYVGIHAMIPDTRSRQPRDGPMKCGNQPADISVIHRRYKLRASRSLSGAIPIPGPSTRASSRELTPRQLTGAGHISRRIAGRRV